MRSCVYQSRYWKKKIEELLDLQEQYKSCEVAMTRSLEESGGKVTQLSDSVAFFKSIIPDTRKAIALAEKSIDLLENKCQNLEVELRTGRVGSGHRLH